MNNERDDGGPAFPEAGLSGLPNGQHIPGRSGMTLRDYFAAKALQGLLASAVHAPMDEFVARSYAIADAMIKARQS